MKTTMLLVTLLVGVLSAQVNTTIQPTDTRYDYDLTVTDSDSTQIHVHHIVPNDYISYGDYSNRCEGLSRFHTQIGPNPTQLNRTPGTTVEDIYSCTTPDGTLWQLKFDGVLYWNKGRGGRACGGCGVFIVINGGTFSEGQ
jgi:hypothetical protein